MQKFSVSGMSCAACSARVEKTVKQIPGVSSCAVSLLTNSLRVEGNASANAIISAVEKAGYGARLWETPTLQDTETPVLKKRLIFSLFFLIVLLYGSMAHPIFGFPLPLSPFVAGILQMLLAFIVMFINRKFFISGFTSLLHGGPNMDTLVAMGSGVSFLYSVLVLFNSAGAGNLYFETAAMIVTLITVGKLLESISKGRTTTALKSLLDLAPKKATLWKDEKEISVRVEEVKVGDIFVVKPGEKIPVDGIVLEGNSAVNEAALTGESIPVDKMKNASVSAATLNQSGFLKCRATRVGENTTLSQIIQLVSDASATKAPIAKIADKVSSVFVPAVILIAMVTAAVWIILGKEISIALSHAIAVLVMSCPCALGLATPVAMMVSNGKAAKKGILFKTSASIEEMGRIKIVALDKTGTITEGRPAVTEIFPAEISTAEFLQLAASLESKSEHPLSQAILAKAKEENISLLSVTEFEAFPGNGLAGKIAGQKIFAGKEKFVESKIAISKEWTQRAQALACEGKSPTFFATGEKFLGMIALADSLKSDSAEAIAELKKLGVQTVMLTGDHTKTAEAIAKKVNVDQFVAEILPSEKDAEIRRLQNWGSVAMVGDGINDSPALTRANVGIAIGAGADVAIDAADVVLVQGSLKGIVEAICLSRRTLRIIHQNLFWAFFYNVALMPLAAGAYYAFGGWSMHPILGAAAMSLSSFCVVMNALRLR